MEVRVRCAVKDDVTFLRMGFRGLISDSHDLVRRNSYLPPYITSEADVEQQLARDVFFIGVVEAEPCGFAGVHFPFPSRSTAVVLPNSGAWLRSLYVMPTHRRHGIASMLMKAVEQNCAEWSASSLSLNVISGNEAAERLYKRHGFAANVSTMQKRIAVRGDTEAGEL